jgi:hypothetical protein
MNISSANKLRSKERSVEFVDKNNACAQFIEGKLSTNLIC